MPLIGEFHQQFWNISDTNVPPARLSVGGYPRWQIAVITPSLFGIIGAWLDTHWALLKWHWAIAVRLHRLSAESRALVGKTLDVLESPIYPKAQKAVRKTATTLGFNSDAVGKSLKGYFHAQPGRVENMYRHLHAVRALHETAGSTLTNHEAAFLTELAYQGFGISQK